MLFRLRSGYRRALLVRVFPVTRALAIALFLTASAAIEAKACEYAPPPATAQEARDRAVASYETVEFAYEGMVLGPHDFDRGGRFLVLRSHKGPAKPLQVLTLPSGNSCYRGLSLFGVWAGNTGDAGIDGFVPQDRLTLWRREKLIGGSVLPAIAGGVLAGLLLLAGLIRRRLQRRSRG